MRTLFAVAVALALPIAAIAQAEEPLKFEVASVKPAAPDQRGMFIRPGPGGGVTITNMSLKELIVLAWRVQPFEISGGPPWVESARYDIVAKPETRPKPAELQVMLQLLLQDRFQLAVHRETKELPIYALVLARKDGKLGPQLVESKEGACTPADPTRPPPPPEPGKPPALSCGQMRMSPAGLTVVAMRVGDLAPIVSRFLGRTVVDKTGLTGKFDIHAEWSPDPAQLPPGALAPPPDPAGPSIFTAFQEQLGLKVESQKGPVEMVIIDRAEKPSEN